MLLSNIAPIDMFRIVDVYLVNPVVIYLLGLLVDSPAIKCI